MKKLIRPLSLAAVLGAGALGANLLADEKKPAAEPPVKVRPVAPGLPAAPGNGNPMGDSKPNTDVAPVKVGDTIAKTDFAMKPKELSAAVKKGLEYLAKAQQEDGGWNQGGGWRNSTDKGGRIEGPKVEDPSDIGNTCFALLALLRAGNTATEGEYKEHVKKGLAFVIARVEKADKDSLYVTDVRGTQLQGKIGQYVDTFLVNLVLAEFRGKSGDQEKKLVAALEKTMTKIVRHQTADGGFAGNAGWAPTLSLAICNKSIARARERGAVVDEVVLKRAQAQAAGAATGTAPVAVAPVPEQELAHRRRQPPEDVRPLNRAFVERQLDLEVGPEGLDEGREGVDQPVGQRQDQQQPGKRSQGRLMRFREGSLGKRERRPWPPPETPVSEVPDRESKAGTIGRGESWNTSRARTHPVRNVRGGSVQAGLDGGLTPRTIARSQEIPMRPSGWRAAWKPLGRGPSSIIARTSSFGREGVPRSNHSSKSSSKRSSTMRISTSP
ncbi:MAG: hypothetical protein J0I06_15535, partial [Planctomycetes bacterium]|nr:hypothetical protein [Planctomycetota bacterium]